MKLASSVALLYVAILAAFVCPLLGQTRINNSGTGGINTIKGQIFSPSDRRADGQVTVRLQSFTFGELSVITDQSGGFEFRNLAAGSYFVVVDAGDTFETFRESVLIDGEVQSRDPALRVASRPKLYTVPVYLQLKHTPREKASVINAKMANVPKDALKRYEKALELMQAAKLDEALAELRAAVQIYPALSWAYTEMGKIYLRTGRLDEAVDVLATSLRYEPNDFDANVDYGIALYAKQDYTAAETQLNKAAQLNATAVTPHYYLGRLFLQTKAFEKARSELESAKRLKGDKNFPLVHRDLGDVYRALRLSKEAVAELETYLKLVPNAKDAERVRQTITELKKQI
jgi:tetratricopeptide (TPR) repeat protein